MTIFLCLWFLSYEFVFLSGLMDSMIVLLLSLDMIVL